MSAVAVERHIPPPLRLFIPGRPVPQGSKNVFNGNLVEQNAKGIKTVRKAVADAFTESGHPGFRREAACEAQFTFYFDRPAKHWVAGRKGGTLKENAPKYHSNKPDRDKLDRTVNDALTQCGVWFDDCRNVDGPSTKEYTNDGVEGQGTEIVVQFREWRD